jgi:hypothetical protein
LKSKMNKLFYTLAATALLTVGFLTLLNSNTPVADSDYETKLTQWNDYKTIFGKYYADKTEEIYRMSVFLKNLEMIESHNSKRLSW